MWILRWIFGGLLILIILGFALQNQGETATVRLIKWQSPVLPLYFFLYLSFAAGLITWVIVSALNILKYKGDVLKLQRENRKIRDELNRLRNVSIEDEVEATEIDEDSNPNEI
jgi:uncharacterized integral membrane protein